MNKKTPALRAALRLQQILSRGRRHPHGDPFSYLSGVLGEQQNVERCWRLYCKSRRHGWTHAAAIVFRRLISAIERLPTAAREICPPRIAPISTVTDILAEIEHLEDEFEDVEILPKEKRIDVTTDEITLEGVTLGRFTIQLDFETLSNCKGSSAFVIRAVDANPASRNSSCTHPHVSEKHLCAGDATAPVSAALSEGRIGDAFQLVNRVLHTYNPSSAFVALEEWDGQACEDCGFTASSDSLHYCDHCGKDFCDDCIVICERCSMSVCVGCSEENQAGDRLCPSCKELDDQEREEANEEEDQTAVSDDPVHDPVEEQPQPQQETSHEHAPDALDTQPAGPSGGAPDGPAQAAATDVLETLAARAAVGGDLLPAGLAEVNALPARRRDRGRRVRHQQ